MAISTIIVMDLSLLERCLTMILQHHNYHFLFSGSICNIAIHSTNRSTARLDSFEELKFEWLHCSGVLEEMGDMRPG